MLAKTFYWGTKDGEVISFKPKFEGNYALSTIRNENININTTGDKGKQVIISKPSSDKTKELAGDWSSNGDILSVLAASNVSQSWFDENGDYAYKATLTVLGNHLEMKLGSSTIDVNPIVGTSKHWSAGKYIVNSVTDQVSSQGFTTTYELTKAVKVTNNLYGVDMKTSTDVIVDGAVVPLSEYDPAAAE